MGGFAQENTHLRLLFDQMAARPGINIFRALPAGQFAELRRRLVLLVLSTDMSRHFGLLQDVRQARPRPPGAPPAAPA